MPASARGQIIPANAPDGGEILRQEFYRVLGNDLTAEPVAFHTKSAGVFGDAGPIWAVSNQRATSAPGWPGTRINRGKIPDARNRNGKPHLACCSAKPQSVFTAAKAPLPDIAA